MVWACWELERMSERRLTKGIYMADVSGNAGRGRPRKTYPDLIGEVLQKGRVRSTHNQHACMTRCMNVDEAKGVCKDRSRWRSVVSTYPHGKKAWVYVMYVIKIFRYRILQKNICCRDALLHYNLNIIIIWQTFIYYLTKNTRTKHIGRFIITPWKLCPKWNQSCIVFIVCFCCCKVLCIIQNSALFKTSHEKWNHSKNVVKVKFIFSLCFCPQLFPRRYFNPR